MLTGADLWKSIVKINTAVNKLPYKTDIERYRKNEFWIEIDEKGGDCEDFSLEKRRRLIEIGVPVDELKLAVCYDETGAGHAVLTLDFDDQTWVLDNRYAKPMPWNKLPYRWLMRQDGKRWVEIPEPA